MSSPIFTDPNKDYTISECLPISADTYMFTLMDSAGNGINCSPTPPSVLCWEGFVETTRFISGGGFGREAVTFFSVT